MVPWLIVLTSEELAILGTKEVGMLKYKHTCLQTTELQSKPGNDLSESMAVLCIKIWSL
jgi:hypothetical protein